MVVFENHATLLLVLHTIAAGAVVAASTHTVLWMRGYARGRSARHAGTVRLATWSAIFYVVTFLLGNALYPTYKVRVRGDFLESGSAVSRDLADRSEDAHRARQRTAQSRLMRTGEVLEVPPPTPPTADESQGAFSRTQKLVRWFDIKEHLVVVGMLLAIALTFTLRRWNPKRDGTAIARPLLALAAAASLCAWTAAVVGIVLGATRSVAGL